MSLYSVVSRGVWGHIGQRPIETEPSVEHEVHRVAVHRVDARAQDGRLPGASMRLLEAGLALSAIATAILIGIGR